MIIIEIGVADNGQLRLSPRAITYAGCGRFCDFCIYVIILMLFLKAYKLSTKYYECTLIITTLPS
jgi:hypothetical protein